MDVLKISETKIKIMLTPSDVKSYDLDPAAADYSDKSTKSKVWKILDNVKRRHGFDHENDKLLIQFYPSRDGGAELFVTKLVNLTSGNERNISKSDGVSMLATKKKMYRFYALDDLIKAAKIISSREYIGESDIFFSDDDEYYLEISERGSLRLGSICEFAILSEFANSISREKQPYVTEHYKKLTSGNAVELLSKL